MRSPSKRTLVAASAILLVGLFVIVAAAQGLGHPEPSGDEIAVVEDAPGGEISKEQFDRALEQTARRDQSLGGEVPAEDDPNYEVVRDAAINDLVLAAWVRGEASDRGIEVTESEVDDELETVIEQNFNGNQKQFDRFLEQSGFTPEEARDRIELQVISGRFQEEVVPDEVEVDDDEITAFYDENPQQFEQPETRDVRQLLIEDGGEAEDAASQLRDDPSPKQWKELAEDLSLDEATKDRGGLRAGVIAGTSSEQLDAEVFGADVDEVVGPFETDEGFYVIQVEKVTPPQTTSLDEASEQIRQTLSQARQQQVISAFEGQFVSKWTSRTFCAEGFQITRCANADPPPDPCTKELAESTGCGAPVASTRPIAPGSAAVFGAPAPVGLPQGPITPQAQAAPTGVPPGLTPVPGGGAPPQQAPPAGGAPPQAPPGAGAPPQAPPGG